jgi:hypothetical protein
MKENLLCLVPQCTCSQTSAKNSLQRPSTKNYVCVYIYMHEDFLYTTNHVFYAWCLKRFGFHGFRVVVPKGPTVEFSFIPCLPKVGKINNFRTVVVLVKTQSHCFEKCTTQSLHSLTVNLMSHSIWNIFTGFIVFVFQRYLIHGRHVVETAWLRAARRHCDDVRLKLINSSNTSQTRVITFIKRWEILRIRYTNSFLFQFNYWLFLNDSISFSNYIAWDVRIIVNSELENKWKERVVT